MGVSPAGDTDEEEPEPEALLDAISDDNSTAFPFEAARRSPVISAAFSFAAEKCLASATRDFRTTTAFSSRHKAPTSGFTSLKESQGSGLLLLLLLFKWELWPMRP